MREITKAVRVGYGPYKDKQEAQEAEDKAWLAIPLKERIKLMGLPEDFDPKVGKHDDLCDCAKCHIQAVKDGDIDCGQCSVCAEEAMSKAEALYDQAKENGLV